MIPLQGLKRYGACSRFRRLFAKSASFENSNIEMTTLSNGLKVVTDSTPGHFSAMGAYVKAGSRYENPEKAGLSHIADRLSWKSTEQYTGKEMMENLAKLGGNYMCSAQRESILYQASVFNHDVESMFDCIAQTVRSPKLTTQEVVESLQTAEYEIQEIGQKSDMFLPEVLHAVAYNNNTLGIPMYCPPERLGEVGRSDIVDFHSKFYQPQNVVVAMLGVSHQDAVGLAQLHFLDWKPANTYVPDLGTVKYTGGEISLPYQPPIYANLPELYHMQIGFETEGLLVDDLYALATLQKLLGGGSSFSAGGPGKGMFSRLYTRVLNQYAFVENCTSFNHAYLNSGLFGISISCTPNGAHVMSQIICQELALLMEQDPEKGGLKENEVRRAKNQLISSLLMNVESKIAKLEDLGRQIQCQNKLTSTDEMIQKIERLSVNDLRNVATKIFTGNVITKGESSGQPSVVMQGERESFGDVEYVLRYFGLGKFSGPELLSPRPVSDIVNPKKSRWF